MLQVIAANVAITCLCYSEAITAVFVVRCRVLYRGQRSFIKCTAEQIFLFT